MLIKNFKKLFNVIPKVDDRARKRNIFTAFKGIKRLLLTQIGQVVATHYSTHCWQFCL